MTTSQPLTQLSAFLSDAVRLADAEATDDHPDPIDDAINLTRAAHNAVAGVAAHEQTLRERIAELVTLAESLGHGTALAVSLAKEAMAI